LHMREQVFTTELIIGDDIQAFQVSLGHKFLTGLIIN
jgi:hypothetical protein